MSMNQPFPVLLLIAALFLILLLLALLIVSCFRTRKIMKQLSAMLDDAINGTFRETHMDESMLSSIESRFAAYLSAQETAASHTVREKDSIKELISDISHQTKTPLANIMLYAELLSEQEKNLSPQGRSYLTALHTQTGKLHFLISSLIKLSRLEMEVFVLHPVSAPIRPTLEEVVRQLAPQAQEKGLRILCQPDDSTAVFDAKWTQEALFNLLDNAVKYTEQGSITIEVTPLELFCRITITDTGIGIAEEEHAKIFSRFYRSPQVSDREGIGIGLYLTREIISRQGGWLKLTSARGEGSSFAVYLPRFR